MYSVKLCTNSYIPPAACTSACTCIWSLRGLSFPALISSCTARPFMTAEISASPLRAAVDLHSPRRWSYIPVVFTRLAKCPCICRCAIIARVRPLAVSSRKIVRTLHSGGMRDSLAALRALYSFSKSISACGFIYCARFVARGLFAAARCVPNKPRQLLQLPTIISLPIAHKIYSGCTYSLQIAPCLILAGFAYCITGCGRASYIQHALAILLRKLRPVQL